MCLRPSGLLVLPVLGPPGLVAVPGGTLGSSSWGQRLGPTANLPPGPHKILTPDG
jgi:hypothetical protein